MTPLIRYVTPYSTTKNLAEAMNLEMELAPRGSYVAFVDRDTIWLDPKFGHKISEIIEKNGEAYYTCLTNRTNCEWQRIEYDYDEGNDIEYHKQFNDLCISDNVAVNDHTDSQLWSGHLMICPVDKWIPLKTRGLLGVDNEIHLNARKQGCRVLLMTGIYIYHWYSNFDGKSGHQKRDKSHLV